MICLQNQNMFDWYLFTYCNSMTTTDTDGAIERIQTNNNFDDKSCSMKYN